MYNGTLISAQDILVNKTVLTTASGTCNVKDVSIMDYCDRVYDLIWDDENTFVVNGFWVGDLAMQQRSN